jgi:hypothetical protein
VTLCHATGSRKHPYVTITVSVDATTGNGHGRHDDDIHHPGSGRRVPLRGDRRSRAAAVRRLGRLGRIRWLRRYRRSGTRRTRRWSRWGRALAPAQPPAPVLRPLAQKELPFTGLPVWLLALVGAGATGTGVLLRRKGRPFGNGTAPTSK